MDDVPWISLALMHPSNQRPLRHSFSDDQRAFAIECQARNELGEPLGRECFPQIIYGAPNAKEKDYRLPHLFFAGSYWAISEAAANVLRQFELGDCSLYPVEVFRRDRLTRLEGQWFCINFGNSKRAVVPEKSQRLEPGPQGRYNVPVTLADGQLAVSEVAMRPPDIWVDLQLWDNFFVSGQLGTALRRAKVDKGFFLTKCHRV